MRNFFLSMMLLVAGIVYAQQPVITFSRTQHDFGKINESDGRVTTIFEFKNEGMEPLVLSNVKASCGCTTPSYTKTPVEPGQTGNISVTYNPNGRPGKFQKTVTVTSNGSEQPVKLYIKGEVIPKQAKPVNKYPIKMGELSLNANSLNFGNVFKGNNLTKTITYTNTTDADINVEVLTNEADPIIAQATLQTIKKGQEGQININFDAANCKAWGPQTFYAYVMVNGKKQITPEFRITLTVNVEEDFSKLTTSEKQNAPIAEVAKKIDLGSVTPGKKVKKTLNLKNAGVNPLFVRCIINQSADMLSVTPVKGAVKSGKSGVITMEINGMDGKQPLKPGEYHRTITLVTNDPANSKIQVTVTWTVK